MIKERIEVDATCDFCGRDNPIVYREIRTDDGKRWCICTGCINALGNADAVELFDMAFSGGRSVESALAMERIDNDNAESYRGFRFHASAVANFMSKFERILKHRAGISDAIPEEHRPVREFNRNASKG